MVFKAAQHRAQHGATRRATHCSKFACQSSVAMYQSMAGPRFWRIVTIDARHNHQNQGLVIIDALHSSILQHSKFHVTCDNASNLTSAGSSFSPCPSGERENEERRRVGKGGKGREQLRAQRKGRGREAKGKRDCNYRRAFSKKGSGDYQHAKGTAPQTHPRELGGIT